MGNKTRDSIMGLYNQIKHNVEVMSITLPDDKKKIIAKEMVALEEKLVVVGQFEEKVKVIEDFCSAIKNFDGSMKSINDWMMLATKELEDIKNSSDKMAPEDRVARTMDLQEDIAAKFEIIKANTAAELELLPQGEKVPEDAQAHKDELNRITKYVSDLQEKVKTECDNFSEDVKFWAEYKTGIKEFAPWLSQAEVAAMRERYAKVKAVADEWVKKVDTLVKEWALLDNTVTELNAWVAKDKTSDGENQFSLEKMESTLGELKNIFKEKEKLVENL